MIARVTSVDKVPNSLVKLGTVKALDDRLGKAAACVPLTVEQQQEELMGKIDLAGLEAWPTNKAEEAC